VASAAAAVSSIADALGIGQFAVMGHSGGSPHALACEWLARHTRSAELWLRPDDGHVSVLHSAATAMDWLREHANQG
jgi:pimeloyl-ACP methyl ester carboxylesterase